MSATIHIGGKCPKCGQPIHIYLNKRQLKQMLASVKLLSEKARNQAIRDIVSNLKFEKGVNV